MEDSSGHFHHILHDFLDWSIGNGHVHGTDGNHEVKTGNDVASVLDQLVKVGEVVTSLCVSIVQIVGEMSQSIEYGHILGEG